MSMRAVDGGSGFRRRPLARVTNVLTGASALVGEAVPGGPVHVFEISGGAMAGYIHPEISDTHAGAASAGVAALAALAALVAGPVAVGYGLVALGAPWWGTTLGVLFLGLPLGVWASDLVEGLLQA